MDNKNQQSSHSSNSDDPPYESEGRSIADDVVIDRLVETLKGIGKPNLAEEIFEELKRNSGSAYDTYLSEKMNPTQVIRYNTPDNVTDYNNRLKYLAQSQQTPG